MYKYLILLFISVNSYAEFNNCNGVFTNKPCEQINKKPSLTKTKNKKTDQSNIAKDSKDSKKESLIHNLKMLSIKAKREHDLDYSLDAIEKECRNNTLIECDSLIKNSSKDLQERINQEKILELKQLDAEAKKEENNDNKTTVVIQNNNVIVPQRLTPRRRPINKIRPRRNLRSLKSDQNSSSPTNVR